MKKEEGLERASTSAFEKNKIVALLFSGVIWMNNRKDIIKNLLNKHPDAFLFLEMD